MWQTLQWRHNERDGFSNHWHLECLLKHLFRCRSKKSSKFCVTGLCEGNTVTYGFPSQRASNAENVSIWWCHHVMKKGFAISVWWMARNANLCISIAEKKTLQHLKDKQRVLMHRHQGLNVRHGLCHIYMRYLYIYELFIAFVCFVVCSLL